MNVSVPAELLFAVGVILFCLSLFFYGFVLRRLLVIIRHPSTLWIFPLLGSGLLGLGAIFHFLPLPVYPHIDPSRTDVIIRILQERMLEALFLFLAGVISLSSAFLYFRWVSKR